MRQRGVAFGKLLRVVKKSPRSSRSSRSSIEFSVSELFFGCLRVSLFMCIFVFICFCMFSCSSAHLCSVCLDVYLSTCLFVSCLLIFPDISKEIRVLREESCGKEVLLSVSF